MQEALQAELQDIYCKSGAVSTFFLTTEINPDPQQFLTARSARFGQGFKAGNNLKKLFVNTALAHLVK